MHINVVASSNPSGVDAGAEEVDVPGEHLHRRGHPLPATGGGQEV